MPVDAASFADLIPPDYLTARTQFRDAAATQGLRHEAFSVSSTADLTIDVARIGPENTDRLVIVSGGLHGIEGPFGSGVQLAVLKQKWPTDVGILLIHALNPFGYQHFRRADAENIDLNRNFLKPDEDYRGVPKNHDLTDPIINPPRPPKRWDFFLIRLWWLKEQLGLKAVRQAIAGGQFENPQGLFFGGHNQSMTLRILDANLPRLIGPARQVIHLDYHTGLGPMGTHKLLVEHAKDSVRYDRWRVRFGDVVESCGGPTAYISRGGIDAWIENRFPNIELDSVCAEFGTYPALHVLRALRYENLAYHYTKPDSKHRSMAAAKMREAFVPADRQWRETVVRDGLGLVTKAVASLAKP